MRLFLNEVASRERTQNKYPSRITHHGFRSFVNYPAAETAGRLKIVCLFSVSFPQSLSSPFGDREYFESNTTKILDKPE